MKSNLQNIRGNVMTIDARLELFKKQFPKEKIKSVQERVGADHSVLEINHTWMCKSAHKQEGVVLLEREAKVLNLLQDKITTAIPVPLHYEENFLVYKKIPGSPLIPYSFVRFGKKQQAKLAFDVAVFIAELHNALTPEEIASLGLAPVDRTWSFEALDANRHYLAHSNELIELFDHIIENAKEDLQGTFEPVLIHNNMIFKNIIVDPLTGKLRGIINFTGVAYDDRLLDLRMHRENKIDFTQGVGVFYDMINSSTEKPSRAYSYYFVTEFSRYFQELQDKKEQAAKETLGGILGSIREALASDETADDNSEEDSHGSDCGDNCNAAMHGVKSDAAMLSAQNQEVANQL